MKIDDNDNGHDSKEPTDWRYRFHIFLAYVSGVCKGISQQNMGQNMVQYLHFRILEFPLKNVFDQPQDQSTDSQ